MDRYPAENKVAVHDHRGAPATRATSACQADQETLRLGVRLPLRGSVTLHGPVRVLVAESLFTEVGGA